MLNLCPFTQVSASLWSRLPLSQLVEQGFVGMNTHAAAFRTGRASSFQWALNKRSYIFLRAGLMSNDAVVRKYTIPISNRVYANPIPATT